MDRRLRTRAAAVIALTVAAAAPVVGALTVPSCTTFDGVTVPSDAASTSDMTAAPDSALAADADAGPDSAGPPGFLSIDDSARVCALVFKCPELASSVLASVAVPVDPLNYSLCVHWLAAPVPADRAGLAVQAQTFACMVGGASCNAASACLSQELVAPTDPRCAKASADAGGRCADDGGTVQNCVGGYFLHCGAAYYGPGSTCQTGQDGTHYCALGTNCTVSSSCIGTILDYCGDNLHESINCAYDGYTCDVASNDDSGLPNCNTGNLYVPCSAASTSCSGAAVHVCDGQQVSVFDCAALGLTCLSQSGPAICGTSKDACTPFDPGINTCAGSSLSLCVGGHPQKVDCASLGLSCIPGAGAQSGHCG